MLGKKVLIVDDAEPIRLALQTVMHNLGLPEGSVFLAEDGLLALDAFQEHRPDVVFMDLVMPGLDGEELSQAILKIEPRTKIVLLTGTSLEDNRVRRVLSNGAFEIMQKPVRLSDIHAVFKGIEREDMGLRRVS